MMHSVEQIIGFGNKHQYVLCDETELILIFFTDVVY